jgi:hypothetical protein
MYVGFPKALKRGVFNFEAKLPSACKIGMYIGFEVNSGGQFAGLVALGCELADGQWRMKACNVAGGINGHNVSLNNPDVWDFYSLVLDPPYLYLYESPIGSAGTYPLTLLYKMDILNVVIKGIPFFCNEATVLSEFQMGNIWIYELPEGKHDFTHYYQAINGSAADGATVISNTAGKIIKIHRIFLQSTVDGATDVYLYEETSGSKVTTNTTLNAREGRESPFAQNPACIGQTAVANKKVLLKNAAAKQVNWEIIYSLEDG